MSSENSKDPGLEIKAQIPELKDKREQPAGVVSKQSQTYVIVALALMILLAVLFSNKRAKQTAPLPIAITNAAPGEATQHNVQQLQADLSETQKQVQEQGRKDKQAHKSSNAADDTDTQRNEERHALSNASFGAQSESHRDPIADAERAMRFKSRFASNLVGTSESTQAVAAPPTYPIGTAERTVPDASAPAATTAKRPAEISVNSAYGQPYALFEGTTIDTVLVTRLNGDFSGPVKVMVSNPVYTQDRQHVLIPEGTFVLGEVQKVSGFGQRRLSIVFHRMIMPDGYSVDLDQFHGLDAAGETGLVDQVNNHYIQIFGSSIALGVIAGAAEATTNTGFTETGSDTLRQGVASSLAQSSAHVLDRFLNILPTITIREGHRIKVYLTQDLLLPAYENHTMPPDL